MDKKEPWSFALVLRTWTSLRTRTAPGVLKRFGAGLKKKGSNSPRRGGAFGEMSSINEPEKSWFQLLYAKLPPSRITALSWQRGLYITQWSYKCRATQDVLQRKQGNFRKTTISVSLTMLKSLRGSWWTVESSQRDENTRLSYLSPEKPVCGASSSS